MSETTRDGRELEAWIEFPDPPHQIRLGRARGRLLAGYVGAGLLLLAALGLLVASFSFDRGGRNLVLDTALALGLGEPLPQTRVTIGGCDAAGADRWTCTATVIGPGRRTTVLTIETTTRFDLRPLGAGTVLGATAIYWPPGTLLPRWRNFALPTAIALGLMILAGLVLARTAPDRRLLRAGQGQIRVVDLLTWKGRCWFAFPDHRGRTRFQRADARIVPLVLDGLRTQGAALVTGRSAVLLGARLEPIELPAETRAELVATAELLRNGGPARLPIPPQPDDAPTTMRRIERIENRVAAEPDKDELSELYDAAWRLGWDSDDESVTDRTLHARNTIAKLLGPRRTLAALRDCRERYV